MKKRNKFLIYLIGFLIPIFILFFFPFTKVGDSLNLWWIDFLFAVRGVEKTPDNIIVVAIDEPSFQELGLQWPWPRSLHAQLINNLKKAGAKAIAFDVLFVEPSKYPGDDKIFAESIKNAGNVILGANISQIKRKNFTQVIIVKPLKILEEACNTVALVNFTPDPDGIIRHGRFLIGKTPTLSYAATSVAYKNKFPKQQHGIYSSFLIDFRGPSGNIKTVSYYQALEMDKYLPKDIFKDKIVFVGLASDAAVEVSKGAVDAFPTPFFRISRKAMFGVEIHANTAFTITEGTPLKEIDNIFLIIFFLILSIIPFKFKDHPQRLAIYSIAAIIILSLCSISFFIYKKFVFKLTISLISIVSATTYWGLAGFISTYKDKKMIKDAFDKYVPPAVVNEVLKNPGLLKLGGEKKELTVLFSDIRGFTSLSEKLEPEKLVFLLNEYLSEMTEKVFKNHGLLDKYIGDAIMAVFGAPIPREDHAYCGCKTAMDMINSLEKVGKVWEKRGMPSPRIGIGINTGLMVVGNMGSFERFDYTVIGDEVNLASRLEGLNKVYGTSIIVAENTYNKVKNDFLFRELDYVKVKGKAKPVKIYELIQEDEPDENLKKLIRYFSEGLNFYRDGKWEKAEKFFKKVLEIDEKDNPAKVFIERCKILMTTPLEEKWDGVWTMTTK